MEPSDKKVRIPRTAARRTEQCWARLLCRVDADKLTPMAFDGKLMRCGAIVPESELRPDPEYPAVPILLEHAGIAVPGWGHRRSEQLYVLWRYERDRAERREIARATAADTSWAESLAPVAARALANQVRVLPTTSCGQVVDELVGLLDRRLYDQPDDSGRIVLLNLVYNAVAHRLSETMEDHAYASYNGRRGPQRESGRGACQDARGEVDARRA